MAMKSEKGVGENQMGPPGLSQRAFFFETWAQMVDNPSESSRSSRGWESQPGTRAWRCNILAEGANGQTSLEVFFVRSKIYFYPWDYVTWCVGSDYDNGIFSFGSPQTKSAAEIYR